MKKVIISMLMGIAVVLFISACEEEPSDKYVGDWFASSPDGYMDVHFSEDEVLTMEESEPGAQPVEEEGPKKATRDFKQKSSGVEGDERYYEVDIEDEKHYIVFEDKDDVANAKVLFKDRDGSLAFHMSKDGYPEPYQ